MTRPKTQLTAKQLELLDDAATKVTAWRKAEFAARLAVVTAHLMGVPVRDVEAATGVPARTVTNWTASTNPANHAPSEPAPGLPDRDDALRLLQIAATAGIGMDDLERLIEALPTPRKGRARP